MTTPGPAGTVDTSMAEIINLRTARKRKQRAISAQKADDNRYKFGRTKVEKQLSKDRIARDKRKLDGFKLTGSPTNQEDS